MNAAPDGAAIVRDAFDAYREGFRAFTARARTHFEAGDWLAVQRDSAERLDLYGSCLAEALDRLGKRLGDRFHERPLWRAANKVYARGLPGRPDVDLAETFFNSVTRRVFATEGVDPAVEFVHPRRHGAAAHALRRGRPRRARAGRTPRASWPGFSTTTASAAATRTWAATPPSSRASSTRGTRPRSRPSRPPARSSSATRAPTSSGARGAGAGRATRS